MTESSESQNNLIAEKQPIICNKRPASKEFNEVIGNLLGRLVKKWKKQMATDLQFKFPNEDGGAEEVIFTVNFSSMVLSHQSRVFDEMLNGQQTSPILITEVPFATFKKLIEKLCGVDVEFATIEEVCNFYIAAQKFECQDMIEFAREYFQENISAENVSQIYACIEPFEDEDIEELCKKKFKVKLVKIVDESNFFDYEPVKEQAFVVKPNAEVVKTIKSAYNDVRNESNLETKISKGLGLIKVLSGMAKKTMQEILPNSDIFMRTKIADYSEEEIDSDEENCSCRCDFAKCDNERVYRECLCDGCSYYRNRYSCCC